MRYAVKLVMQNIWPGIEHSTDKDGNQINGFQIWAAAYSCRIGYKTFISGLYPMVRMYDGSNPDILNIFKDCPEYELIRFASVLCVSPSIDSILHKPMRDTVAREHMFDITLAAMKNKFDEAITCLLPVYACDHWKCRPVLSIMAISYGLKSETVEVMQPDLRALIWAAVRGALTESLLVHFTLYPPSEMLDTALIACVVCAWIQGNSRLVNELRRLPCWNPSLKEQVQNYFNRFAGHMGSCCYGKNLISNHVETRITTGPARTMNRCPTFRPPADILAWLFHPGTPLSASVMNYVNAGSCLEYLVHPCVDPSKLSSYVEQHEIFNWPYTLSRYMCHYPTCLETFEFETFLHEHEALHKTGEIGEEMEDELRMIWNSEKHFDLSRFILLSAHA
jgi:hypothetical protein